MGRSWVWLTLMERGTWDLQSGGTNLGICTSVHPRAPILHAEFWVEGAGWFDTKHVAMVLKGVVAHLPHGDGNQTSGPFLLT